MQRVEESMDEGRGEGGVGVSDSDIFALIQVRNKLLEYRTKYYMTYCSL